MWSSFQILVAMVFALMRCKKKKHKNLLPELFFFPLLQSVELMKQHLGCFIKLYKIQFYSKNILPWFDWQTQP